MKIIIVGGGEKGLALANMLANEHQVTLIEQDEARAKVIASKTQVLVLQGDGGDIAILRQANIGEADYVVTTADDKTNLVVCEIAKNEKVPHIVALVNESKNEELFSKLEISNLVFVVGTIVSAIQRIIVQKGTEDIISQLGLGEMQVAKMTVTEGCKAEGAGADINNAKILAIYREGKLITDTVKEKLLRNDTVLFAVAPKDLEELNKFFTSDENTSA
ncbi:TrkA family potassium uptake protein [Patescibacteria group bacterium]|nr:TrkA family potassium uptake protein [Patescibacteria group bacterium]MBU1016190.1 TrkA family potassium uptake protein [Patescibacteria group bacterium]MBU1684693.1 TrkA family potassium uptake protein [Patescibacteria group bacterium]MBU1938944.1 TrkA family potassium uptake protein [Patescibacteria group bacterium]